MYMLLVEDEPALRRAIAGRLTKDGINIDECADGDDARFMLRTHAYDAVILDIMLPNVDGLTLLRELRAAGNATPVLLLTARDSLEDRVSGLDCGADDYLTKPFEYAELSARLRALLRRGAGAASNELSCGGIRVDTGARSVYANDAPVQLSAREYDILLVLLRNRGATLTRGQIESNVWRSDADIGSNIIDVYIRALRKKLGPAGDAIVTVRGVGYRLEAGR